MAFGLQKNPPPLSTPLKPREAGVSSGFSPHMPRSWEIGGKLGSWGKEAGGAGKLCAVMQGTRARDTGTLLVRWLVEKK